jgi:hypothetical protein
MCLLHVYRARACTQRGRLSGQGRNIHDEIDAGNGKQPNNERLGCAGTKNRRRNPSRKCAATKEKKTRSEIHTGKGQELSDKPKRMHISASSDEKQTARSKLGNGLRQIEQTATKK